MIDLLFATDFCQSNGEEIAPVNIYRTMTYPVIFVRRGILYLTGITHFLKVRVLIIRDETRTNERET